MQALEQKGYRNWAPAKTLGISLELLRLTVKRGHIPKDSILEKIADKLGLDRTALLLAAHKEKFPVEVKGYFLSPSKKIKYEKRRVWPLSESTAAICENLISEKTRRSMDNQKVSTAPGLRSSPPCENLGRRLSPRVKNFGLTETMQGMFPKCTEDD